MSGDTSANNDFSRFDSKRLKSLYNASRTVGTLCVVWALGILLLLLVVFVGAIDKEGEPLALMITIGLFIGLIALKIGAFVGCLKRTEWGRILGIIDCCFLLFGFPVGTAIGIIGLVALIPKKELFGPNALDPKALKAEYKLRKQLPMSGVMPPPIR